MKLADEIDEALAKLKPVGEPSKLINPSKETIEKIKKICNEVME